MLSHPVSRALLSTRLLVDMSTLFGLKSDSFHLVVVVPVGVFMCLFAMLYLYCLVTLIISTFTEISELIMDHRLSDVTPTTSSKKDATTITHADDEDTSADNATTVDDATVEDFVDCEYSHQMWMDELLLNYFEYSILLHQMFIQWYQAEFIEETFGYVSILCEFIGHHLISYLVPCLTLFSSQLQLQYYNYTGIR
jgi:hypothetical protein